MASKTSPGHHRHGARRARRRDDRDGSAAVVETVGGTLSEIVDERRIRELPLNERSAAAAAAAAGCRPRLWRYDDVAATARFRSTAFAAFPTTTCWTAETTTTCWAEPPPSCPNPDALEEFTVQTEQLQRRYGRNMGAVINAVTNPAPTPCVAVRTTSCATIRWTRSSSLPLQKGTLRRSRSGATWRTDQPRPGVFLRLVRGSEERQGRNSSNLIVSTLAERTAISRSPASPRIHNRTGLSEQSDSRNRFDPAIVRTPWILIPVPNAPGDRRHLQRTQHEGWLAAHGRSRHPADRSATPLWPGVLRQERAGRYQRPTRSPCGGRVHHLERGSEPYPHPQRETRQFISIHLLRKPISIAVRCRWRRPQFQKMGVNVPNSRRKAPGARWHCSAEESPITGTSTRTRTSPTIDLRCN